MCFKSGSTAEARSEYYSAKAARVLYDDAAHSRRWHDASHRVIGDGEITGVEALRVTDEPNACGLCACR